MALSDSEREQNKKRPIRAVNAGSNYRWSDKQKMECVTGWLAVGNLSAISRLTGVPEPTIRMWKQSEWWKTLVDDLKSQERIELSNRMKRIIDAAHVVVEQRLTNGDPFVTKEGKVDFKPVALKDAHRVAVDLLNQRDTVERVNAPVAERESTNEDKLKQLAEKFATFASQSLEKKLNKPKEIIDVTDVTIKPETVQEVPPDEGRASVQEGQGL